MAGFDIPAAPRRNVAKIDTFKGVDLNSSPSNVKIYRSPNAPNMMRDIPGKVRKRQGYEKLTTYPGRINGVHILHDPETNTRKLLIHAGTALYLGEEKLYEGMADERSTGRQFFGKVFIFDGKKALCYGEFEVKDDTESGTTGNDSGTTGETEEKKKAFMVKALEEEAYVPTVIISRNPTGGGVTLEPLNLIGRKWKESFLSDGAAKTYQLTAKELDADEVEVKLLQSDGTWAKKKEGTDFTVDRTKGTVTFTTAPGKSPVTGSDNVEITAAKTRKGYADRINKCRIISLFGVNGAMDRMFISGNPDYPNQDWYCKMGDGFFWGDLWYSTLGQDGSAVVGYTIINDSLAAHKGNAEEGRNVILRKGTMEGDDVTFPVVGTLSGRGACASHAFGYLASEPVFLTDIGVMAITAADLTGEKYSQSRSYYIDNALTTEQNLQDAFAYVWRDFYLISVGTGRVYLLDGMQKEYDKNSPHSNFQYECYYWDNVPARVFWEDEHGRLCFGDRLGNIYRFYDDVTSLASYNDNGAAIPARWDTPDLTGELFYKNKSFRRVDCKLAPGIATGTKVFAQIRGIWTELFSSGVSAKFFDFNYLDLAEFTFATDTTPRTIGTKIRIKKVDKAAFSLRNEELNESLGIYELCVEFTENGNYKG